MADRKTILRLLRYTLLMFVAAAGIITIAASGGGGDGGDATIASGSGSTGGSASADSEYDESALPEGTSYTYEDDDSNPTTITFGSNEITGDTAGATYDGNIVTINTPGTFNITGTVADGQIRVDTLEDGDVRLVFMNADITCSFGPPLDIENAERVIIRLEAGTDNSLTDTHTTEVYDEDGDEIDAALYSKEDLVISGTGSLSVETGYKDGIKSKDSLIIDSGNITVVSADDGIIGKNFISVESGDIYIDAGGDGLKSTEDDDADQGYIYITDGVFDIEAGADAVQVETNIVIMDGDFNISTGGGSSYSTSDTAKGLKSPIGITIYNGEFIIDTADDSIHSNDTIVINGGDFQISSADDAIHADIEITVNDGTIDILDCYEGIEGMVININDGDIHVESYDDPINATDGNGGENTSGVAIYINGGYMYLRCTNADGFDSNGAVYLTGGTVVINGPTSGSNGILDYGTFKTTGGTIIGAGTSSMAQAPGSSSSSQNALLFVFSQKSAGTLFHIENSSGTDIVTFAPAKTYSSVVFSSPDLITGSTYNVYMGGSYSGGSETDGLYSGGSYSGGQRYFSFTISSRVTTVR